MKKLLLIGDLHVKDSNLEESRRLLDKLSEIAVGHDYAIHFGDIYNDHGIITAPVQKAVADFFDKISHDTDFINIEGNHDKHSNGVDSSLYVHKFQTEVDLVLKPGIIAFDLSGAALLVPYIKDPKVFIDIVTEYIARHSGIKTVFCHQEFNGGQFENGFYIPNGVDPALFPNLTFVSGHIHAKASFGNVFYVGSPRWITKNDANQERGVWSAEFENGKIAKVDFISTEDVCAVRRSLKLIPQDIPNLPTFKDIDLISVEYEGDSEQDIEKIRDKYKKVSIKHIIKKENCAIIIREAEGILTSVTKYVNSLDLKVDKEILLKQIMERLYGRRKDNSTATSSP